MKECDTFLMIGSAFPYSEFLPKPGNARGVQIDIDGARLEPALSDGSQPRRRQRRDPRALLPMLKQKPSRRWREGIEKGVADWWKTLEERAMQPADPINPQRIFWELSPLLPDNCHHDGRSRLGRQLVRARHQDPARHDGLAVWRPGVAGRGDALRDGGQDGLPGPPRHRASSAMARCR